MDASALRIEFFGDLMRQVNSILFEGEENKRVPFHSWDKVHLLQMGGLMLAHSIVQKGPGMAMLASYVYEFISSGEKSKAVALVMEDDLQDTPQNKDLSDFLKKVHYVYYIYLYLYYYLHDKRNIPPGETGYTGNLLSCVLTHFAPSVCH